jgi:hypothetical protein
MGLYDGSIGCFPCEKSSVIVSSNNRSLKDAILKANMVVGVSYTCDYRHIERLPRACSRAPRECQFEIYIIEKLQEADSNRN